MIQGVAKHLLTTGFVAHQSRPHCLCFSVCGGLVNIAFMSGNAAPRPNLAVIDDLRLVTRPCARRSSQPADRPKSGCGRSGDSAAPAIGAALVRHDFYGSVMFRSVPAQIRRKRQGRHSSQEGAWSASKERPMARLPQAPVAGGRPRARIARVNESLPGQPAKPFNGAFGIGSIGRLDRTGGSESAFRGAGDSTGLWTLRPAFATAGGYNRSNSRRESNCSFKGAFSDAPGEQGESQLTVNAE